MHGSLSAQSAHKQAAKVQVARWPRISQVTIGNGPWAAWLQVLLLCLGSGCSMCLNSYDHYFAAYGGRRARADMVQGRVGSIFDPAPEIHGPMNGSEEALQGSVVEGLQTLIHPEDQGSEITLKSLQPPELVPPTGSTGSEPSTVAPQRFEIAVE